MNQTSNNRIMIAGGDSHFTYLMQRYVRRLAHKIVSVNLGEDLLATAKCQKPVAIILEVNLPETIGWKTLHTLKTDPETGGIPVMVCSWQDEESRAKAEGADAYLRMPILYADFETALESILMKGENE